MKNNAWYTIKPDDYDLHMSHPNVEQTQMLNKIIKEQFELIPQPKRPISCAAILGITNGNGLEHMISCGVGKVIGIDINEAFLKECQERFGYLNSKLTLFRLDLMTETAKAIELLSPCDLILSNLLIEHIHLNNFAKIMAGLPKHHQILSCVIQINPDGVIASQSGAEHVFDEVVKQVEEADEKALDSSMKACGYALGGRKVYNLPNGKQFIRLDYYADAKGMKP